MQAELVDEFRTTSKPGVEEVHSKTCLNPWCFFFKRFYESHRIFRPSYNTFYEEVKMNHTLLYLGF